MDPFHARLARVALAAAGPFGFALAGGYAVQAHGFLDRPSADVDIFTTSGAGEDFPAAVDAVLAALRGDGLVPEAEIRNASFARIAVAAPDGGATKIEMGVDWRAITASPPPRLRDSRTGLPAGREGSGMTADGQQPGAQEASAAVAGQGLPLRLKVVSPQGIAGVVMRCVSDDFELRDRAGNTGRGFTNLKRILGRPADFALVTCLIHQKLIPS